MSTLPLLISASSDDAAQTADGTTGFSSNSTWIDCQSHTTDDSIRSHGGFRWLNVTIDQGDTIDSATFSGYMWHVDGDDPDCVVWGDNRDNAPTFTVGANDIVGRDGSKTAASVSWVATNIGINAYKSPGDLKTIVQEIINRPTWSNGNALVLLFWANTDIDGSRVGPRSFDFGSNYPKLDIDYTAAGVADPFFENRHPIEAGMKPLTAAGMGGVLIE